MRRLVLFALWIALVAPFAAHAQAAGADSSGAHTLSAIDATHLPPGVLDLGDGWRTHEGDSLSWAQPGFDDSAWEPANLDNLDAAELGWRWYRVRLHLGADHPPLSLLLQGGPGTYELFLNGEKAPGAALRPLFGATRPTEQVFALPDASDVEIAVRTDALRTYTAWHLPLFLSAALGPPDAIESERAAMQSERLYLALPSIAVNLLLILAGLAAFALWRSQRRHAEYLWLGLYLCLLGVSNLLVFSAAAGVLSEAWDNFLGDPLIYVFTIMQIQFTFTFAGKRVGRIWRVYEGLLLAMVMVSALATWPGFSSSVYAMAEALVILPAALLLPVLLFVWYRGGNREAGWLILPSLFPAATTAITDIGTASILSGWGHADFLANPIPLGPISLQVSDLGDLLFLLAIAMVMFFRFARISREQARAAAELEAAQRVQALLLRSAQEHAPGLEIEAVYRPAEEVGGDFFHTALLEGSLTRVVVGDVSGKGMGAAMLVSALVGALDITRDQDPSAVLHQLNELLLDRQQGGFATCVCACIGLDGSLTFANAGHLAPYRNGEEVPLLPGLPLGITPDTGYAKSTVQLAPNDTLTFLSDGVVEAQSASGELFGFERTRAISNQSAKQIVAAAEAYGQQDDITVLTLAFTSAIARG